MTARHPRILSATVFLPVGGQLAKGLHAIGRFLSHHSRRIFARDGLSLPQTTDSPQPHPPRMDVTVIMRSGCGKVSTMIVQLPKSTPIDQIQMEAREALYDQHRVVPDTIDGVRVHFFHLKSPVTALQEAVAQFEAQHDRAPQQR